MSKKLHLSPLSLIFLLFLLLLQAHQHPVFHGLPTLPLFVHFFPPPFAIGRQSSDSSCSAVNGGEAESGCEGVWVVGRVTADWPASLAVGQELDRQSSLERGGRQWVRLYVGERVLCYLNFYFLFNCFSHFSTLKLPSFSLGIVCHLSLCRLI